MLAWPTVLSGPVVSQSPATSDGAHEPMDRNGPAAGREGKRWRRQGSSRLVRYVAEVLALSTLYYVHRRTAIDAPWESDGPDGVGVRACEGSDAKRTFPPLSELPDLRLVARNKSMVRSST